MTPETTLTPWTDTIDPATIPDEVIWQQVGKRRRAKQINPVPGTGRPPVLRPCPHCKLDFAAREFRSHEARCRRQRKAAEAIKARQAKLRKEPAEQRALKLARRQGKTK